MNLIIASTTAMDILKFLIGFGVNSSGFSINMHWMLAIPFFIALYQIDRVRVRRIKKNAIARMD